MSFGVRRHFVRCWSHHTAMQMATLAVLAGTFSVITVSLLVHHNLENILSQWGQSAQVSVYLKDNTSKEQISKVQGFLQTVDILEEVKFVSKEEAAESFKKQMGAYVPDLLFDKGAENPLPASFEVKFGEHLNVSESVSKIKDVVRQVSEITGVDEVSYGQGWVENYASLVGVFKLTSWVLTFILLGGSLFVIGNSIRSSVSQRRDEIEIFELVGATKNLIRIPYIAEGAIMGGLASVSALSATYGLYYWQASYLKENLGFWMLGNTLSYLSWIGVGAVILFGVGIGALGSYICVARLSSGWAAADRQND